MGSRYGVKIRKQEAKVLQEMRKKHFCPKCGKKALKRMGTSLWKCKSCSTQIAGGAYVPRTDIGNTAQKIVSSIKE